MAAAGSPMTGEGTRPDAGPTNTMPRPPTPALSAISAPFTLPSTGMVATPRRARVRPAAARSPAAKAISHSPSPACANRARTRSPAGPSPSGAISSRETFGR